MESHTHTREYVERFIYQDHRNWGRALYMMVPLVVILLGLLLATAIHAF